jgi:hypothetical protein
MADTHKYSYSLGTRTWAATAWEAEAIKMTYIDVLRRDANAQNIKQAGIMHEQTGGLEDP